MTAESCGELAAESQTSQAPALEARIAAENLPTDRDPTADLHFNLWRDFETGSDFFDIGLQIAPTEQIRRLLIFVSDSVEQTDVIDLNPLLKHPDSLNAVFNDIVNVTDHTEGWF